VGNRCACAFCACSTRMESTETQGEESLDNYEIPKRIVTITFWKKTSTHGRKKT
jgi:hypothetical protein